MKHHLLTMLWLAAVSAVSTPVFAQEEWIDVTSQYLVNPGFDGNSNQGWTATHNGGTTTVRANVMEFYNGAFDIHQTIAGLRAGHYRMSVNAFYRCQSNSTGYINYANGQEDITAYMYAGTTDQKLASVYSWSSMTRLNSGDFSPWQVSPSIYFPNNMEGGAAAFAQDAYGNAMEFDHSGGDLNIGLRSDASYINDCWCLFDNFKLEYYGQFTPVVDIAVTAPVTTLVVGESVQLGTTVTPADATIGKVNWTSSDTGIATVDDNGLVTTVGAGNVTITATATDGSGVVGEVDLTVEHNTPTAGALVINEVMAANVDQFISPAYNFDGWVELYNPTDRSLELAGLCFTDNASDLSQWHAPSTIGAIPAHGFKTVWFDSNNLNGNQAPFKLDTDGGTLIISNASGDIVAEVRYPEAMERVSYARTTDGGDAWGLTDTPTPGASNATASFGTEQLSDPVVTPGSQLFTGVMDVHVDIPEGTTLRYTTDGTLPTLTHGQTSENGDLSFTTTTNVRFRLFEQGKLASRAVTRSYIYKDKDYNLPILSVVSDPDFLYNDTIGVYVRGTNGRPGNGQSSACNWNMDWERPVNFSWVTTDNEMTFNQDVNLEMCGGWSRAFTPHSFKLKGDKELGGNKRLDYRFFSAKPYIRNRTLQVRNGGNDTQCRIMDPAVETIIQTSGVDIDCQSYQPVHEFVNGQYIGVLNVREPNNKHYVFANYGWDDDEIDQFEMSPDSGYVQKCGDDQAFNTWYDLSAKAADESAYEEIKQIVDIDEYINYMAAEFYIGGNDWPQNNIKGFRKRDGGKFRFITFDLDQAFRNNNVFNVFMNKQTYRFDRLYGCPVDHITAEIKMVTIFRNMLQNEDFRKKFIDTYCIMGGSVFEPTRCSAVIDSLTATVSPEMALNGESPMSTANSLKSSINNRLSTAMSNLTDYSTFGLNASDAQTATLSSSVDGASLYINGIEVPTGRFNGKLFAPVTLRAEAPAGYTFRGWKTTTSSSSMTQLFAKGSVWRIYDHGSLDNTSWNKNGYSLTSWKSGSAPLGYGKSSIVTTLDYGTSSNNKRPTYYLRRNVILSSKPSTNDVFELNYTVDDGFIVYVNGTEAGRYNMSGNGYSTYADSYAPGNPDNGTLTLNASLFRQGTNVIAVEVHNNSATSSDIYWDAELMTTVGAKPSEADYYSTDAEITMPEGNFTLVADYEPMDNLADSGFTPVRINEISGANDTYVNDYAKKSDWVELYNTTSEPQDVEGMYLTNDPGNLQKSRLTKGDTQANTVIPAHGYMVVWCDKRDPVSDLHASFNIAAGGGTIALTAADQSWTDSLSYPAHDALHTVGRYTDGGNDIYLLSQPTIGKHNIMTSYSTLLAHQVPTGIQIINTGKTESNALQMRYAAGELIIHGQAAQVTVDIFTLSGQQVTSAVVNMNGGLGRVKASLLQQGCYVARATDGDGHTSTCKFVK